MKATHSEQCRTYPKAQILYGTATWDDNNHSIKYAYPDKNGNTARTSPEVPMHAFLQMIEVALKQGGITPKEVVTVLHKVMK